MSVIEIKNLSFGYNESLVLNNINFKLDKKDFVAIAGENGSGKSTLIRLILGELKKDSGSIRLFSTDIEKFRDFHKIGYVPQVNDSIKMGFPITCREYVGLNLYKEFNILKKIKSSGKKKVEDIFEKLYIEDLIDRPFNKLSGGQSQRVMIARALVSNPELLVLDEPTVGIDQNSKEDFLKLLKDLNSKNAISILIISHEMDILGKYVDKTFKIRLGVIC